MRLKSGKVFVSSRFSPLLHTRAAVHTEQNSTQTPSSTAIDMANSNTAPLLRVGVDNGESDDALADQAPRYMNVQQLIKADPTRVLSYVCLYRPSTRCWLIYHFPSGALASTPMLCSLHPQVQEQGFRKLGTFQVQDAQLLAALAGRNMLTYGSTSADPDVESMWRQQLDRLAPEASQGV